MIPNTFIIGAPKCGTSAICHYLSEHPSVYFSSPKEPFYLAEDYPGIRARYGVQDEEAYLGLFSAAVPELHKVIAEGSTNYLMSERALQKAIGLAPDAKFIVMIRNPVDVAHAFHMEQRFSRNESLDSFEEAWSLCEARKNGNHLPAGCFEPKFLDYKYVAMFGQQMERLYSTIPRERCLLILHEELVADTKAVYENVLAFLGLPSDEREDFPLVNQSRRHAIGPLADFVLHPPRIVRPAIERLRSALRRGSFPVVDRVKDALMVKEKRSPLRSDFRSILVDQFSDDIGRLSVVIDRDLSHWLSARG